MYIMAAKEVHDVSIVTTQESVKSPSNMNTHQPRGGTTASRDPKIIDFRWCDSMYFTIEAFTWIAVEGSEKNCYHSSETKFSSSSSI